MNKIIDKNHYLSKFSLFEPRKERKKKVMTRKYFVIVKEYDDFLYIFFVCFAGSKNENFDK